MLTATTGGSCGTQDGDNAADGAPPMLRTVDAIAEYRIASEANDVDRLVDALVSSKAGLGVSSAP